MKNEKGVTLLELLVVVLVMGIILVPISNLVIISLKTEKEVSIKNDVQREARLIMEYVTEKMRDYDITWYPLNNDSGSKKLIDGSNKDVLIEYEKHEGNKGIIKKDGIVLSENIKEFTVSENENPVKVKLIIEKSGFEFELKSEIIRDQRFKY
ncbi:prepilin-type N-terminal cleavage/methylation domain-containing protein [Cytobacillus massiliigabonensis]|uniref:prepilin-type N-terminal cleavage/methylation domain-containing protein n=1 Tax=Cytobacillus massiliigabonensis TaxID=1871011 RepID=UPI000C858D98|nr:prepilin-type N-terminal cleavage/methylation domain-containing protein [Cytobacillus massiliigabonensis]